MKIKNFSTYEFNKYNVVGVKAKINFVKTNNLEIIAHEELSKPIEEQSINLVKEFEPLLFSADIETTKLVNDKELNIDHLTLLDGHHRYDFIIRNVIDLPIEVIIISSNDVDGLLIGGASLNSPASCQAASAGRMSEAMQPGALCDSAMA